MEQTKYYSPDEVYAKAFKLYTGIHWLKAWKDDNKLQIEWHQSEGNITIVQKNLDRSDSLMPEDALIALTQRLIVVVDDPGMGKSSTFNKLSEELKKKNPMSIVIKINLNKTQDLLTSYSIKTKSELVDNLLYVKHKLNYNCLDRKILDYKLDCKGQVVLLCDGFDEVVDKQDDLLNFFKFVIEKTKASIWITTRPSDKDKLENYFSVLGYSFIPIERSESVDYLNKFWKISLTFSEQNRQELNFKKIAQKVTDHFKTIFHTENGGRGYILIPLMMRMLAEKFTDVVNSLLVNQVVEDSLIEVEIEKVNCVNIYKSFVDRMVEIYLLDKIGLQRMLDEDSQSVLKNAYSEAYGTLAVTLIGGERYKDPKMYLSECKDISLNTLSKVGFIQSYASQHIAFIHRYFVYYFAAEIIYKNLMGRRINESKFWGFVLDIMLQQPFGRNFFDDKLKENDLYLLLRHSESRLQVCEILIKQVKNKRKHVALWKAAADDLKSTVKFLSRCMKSPKERENILLTKNSSYLTCDFNERFFEFVLNRGKFLCTGRELEIRLYIKENFRNKLH